MTRDQQIGFTDSNNAILWLMQLTAHLLIIAGILINVGLIRARNIRRSAPLKLDSTYKKSNTGWSLDLTNTNTEKI